MDPKRKRKSEADSHRKKAPSARPSQPPAQPSASKPLDPDTPTEADLAEKEWKNLWEATEVIDMDKW
jgi:hypothetical protein